MVALSLHCTDIWGFLPLAFSKYIPPAQNLNTVLFSPSNHCQFFPFLSDPVLCPCSCSVHCGLSSDLGSTSSTESPVLTQPLSEEQTNGYVCVQTEK